MNFPEITSSGGNNQASVTESETTGTQKDSFYEFSVGSTLGKNIVS